MSTQSKSGKDAGSVACWPIGDPVDPRSVRERPRTPIRRSYAGSCALAHLALDVLALVADALALVGLGRALLADDRRSLPDELLRDALDDHAGRLRHFEFDAVRRGDGNRVGVADGQLEVLALQLGAIADALDLQPLFEARRHTLDHVRDQ